MPFSKFSKQKIQIAEETPFDNFSNNFTADNVQKAIEEIGASASPGFSWGRSGNNSSGTWLDNEGVSSNRSGRLVFINNPTLAFIFVNTRNIATYTIAVYEHEGDEVNLTELDTLDITSSRGGFKTSNVTVTPGRQLAVRITSGSGQDMVAGVIIKGNS
jgi:hypothetical protein